MVSIISLLVSLLLPSLSKVRETARRVVCASNQHSLTVAAAAYASANKDWMNPLEDFVEPPPEFAGQEVEITFRVLLWKYVGGVAAVFDCPSERLYLYADGFSDADEKRAIALGGPITTDRERWGRLYGVAHPLERWNFGGIGIAGVHWFRKNPPDLMTRPRTMPFGRPTESAYREGLNKYSEIRTPGRLIWFGDGAGDDTGVQWGTDNGWWIRSSASDYSQGDPGFNRLLQNDYGCRRHSNKANYAFADGHVDLLDANRIPCNQDQCSWSIRPDVHRTQSVALMGFP
jgi:prepilin-type processing-associated H-X9-DG protein